MVVLIFVVLGLCLGSFVNALVWRLREQELVHEKRTKLSKAEKRAMSIAKGRSMCPSCRHSLSAKDLIPLFSWLALRGKCRYCKAKISWKYPLVELGTALVFALSYVYWPQELSGEGLYRFVFWLIFVVGFVALLEYDRKWFLLPDKIVYPLMVLSLVQLLGQFALFGCDTSLLLGALGGVLSIAGLFYLIFAVSGGKWIGGGDVKLGVVLGVLAGGVLQGLLLIFVASILGTFLSLILMARKNVKRNSLIPFGPFLIIGVGAVVIFGQQILELYTSILL